MTPSGAPGIDGYVHLGNALGVWKKPQAAIVESERRQNAEFDFRKARDSIFRFYAGAHSDDIEIGAVALF